MINFGRVVKDRKLSTSIANPKVVIDMQILVIVLVTNLSFSTSVLLTVIELFGLFW